MFVIDELFAETVVGTGEGMALLHHNEGTVEAEFAGGHKVRKDDGGASRNPSSTTERVGHCTSAQARLCFPQYTSE